MLDMNIVRRRSLKRLEDIERLRDDSASHHAHHTHHKEDIKPQNAHCFVG
jgi:hypothetical protein